MNPTCPMALYANEGPYFGPYTKATLSRLIINCKSFEQLSELLGVPAKNFDPDYPGFAGSGIPTVYKLCKLKFYHDLAEERRRNEQLIKTIQK